MNSSHRWPAAAEAPHALPTTGGLRIQLLGAFRVWIGASEISASAFRRRKARDLVKLLALAPGNRLHRDRLSYLLWPDLAPDKAVSQLYNALSQARKALATHDGPPSVKLVLQGSVVALEEPGGVHTDVEAFEVLAGRAQSDATVEALERAIGSYGGDLLPDDLYEDWSIDRRQSLEELYVDLSCRLAGQYIAQGRAAEALAPLQETIRRAPLHEVAHRHLIQAYGRLGELDRALRQYDSYAEVLHDQLDAEPSEEVRRALQIALDVNAGAATKSLPPQARPFVGRTFELHEIAARLADPDSRLLTLVGLGGIGKTRLAIEAASRARTHYGHGCVFVPLLNVRTAEQLVAAITEALGLPPVAEDARRRLVRYLMDKHLLLVLDNADEAVQAGGVIGELLERCPRLHVMVTSRQRLSLRSEWAFEVGGLQVPRSEAAADPTRFSAVQLFLQGARRVRPQRAFSAEDIEAIRRICRLLRGVPLAIEIASSWVSGVSCDHIAAELESDIGLALTSFQDAPERHRSLRSAFAYSWTLLDERDRHAFARLAVFEGSFGLDAAKEVAGAPLGALARLADRSLLGRTTSDLFEIHPVLRRFALERLCEMPEEQHVREGHAHYFLRRLSEWEKDHRNAGAAEALAAINTDIDNVRAAWAWAARAGDAALLGRSAHALFVYMELRGWFTEGVDLLTRAADAVSVDGPAPASVERARLQGLQGALLQRVGRSQEARDLLRAAADVLERAGEPADVAFLLDRLGVQLHEAGDDAGARDVLHKSLALRQEAGDLEGMATSFNNLGSLAFAKGDFDQAENLFRRGLALQRELGSVKATAISLQNLASIAFAQGRGDEAAELLGEALSLATSAANPGLVCLLLGNLGMVLAASGDRVAATRCFSDALEEARTAGAAYLELRTALHVAFVLADRGDLMRSLELCACVLEDPAVSHDLRSAAARHRAALMRRLPAHLVPEIDRRIRAARLDAVLGEVLSEAFAAPVMPAG